MKIVHVIDYFQPKLGYQETFLAREHAAMGHEVCVVTSDRYNRSVYAGNAAASVLGPRIKGAGFFTEEGIKVWRLKTLFELPNIIWVIGLEKKIRELKPDLVISHGITNLFTVRIARMKKKGVNFKLILDDHAIPENATGKMRVLYPLFRWIFSPGIQKAADALVAILPETRAFMNTRYGVPLERISVIPLGADTELFRFDAAARREVRQELGFKDGEIVFIYTGKIIPMRQLPVFIEASVILMPKYRNVRILFVGGGSPSYIEELKDNVKSKNLSDRFTWLEAVPNEQLYRIYAAADAGVWPYGASVGMREALACSLPIIIGKESRVTELVEGGNGFLFCEGDAGDLAQKMEILLDPGRRAEMGRNSRKLGEERFSWKTIARQFLEVAAG
jgi:glycosyltransferase involved in cell wall biosynthesis